MHIKNFGSRREMLTLNMDVSKLDPISEKLLKNAIDGIDLIDQTILYYDDSFLNPSPKMVEISQ